MEVRRMPSSMSELYHHGIKGQEWGDRNGPPYPLDSNASVQAKKKKKSLITRIKNKRKGKQLQKAKAAKKAEREEKARIINSGNAEEVKKISSKLTNDELDAAIKKIELNAKLNTYTGNGKNVAKTKTGADYVEQIDKTFKMVGSAADGISKAYDLYKKLNGINTGGKKKKKDNDNAKTLKISLEDN